MVQRLGRVNRRRTPGSARIEVVPSPRETKRDADAETEADETQLSLWLRALEALPLAADGEARSASPSDILNLTRRAANDADLDALLRKAVASEPLRPDLTLALVEAWAMTSLEKHTARPEPGPWIRGWTRDPPQARAIWRAFLPLPPDFSPTEEGWLSTEIRPRLNGFFEAAPPHVLETIDAPAHRLADVLKRRSDAWLKRERDDDAPGPTLAMSRVPVVVLLDSACTPTAIWGPRNIKGMKSDDLIERLTGCTAVIDKQLGGIDANGLLSVAEQEPPSTWDEGWDETALQQVARRLRRDRATDAPGDASSGWAVDWRWSPGDDEEGSDEEFLVERLATEPAAGDAARSIEQKLAEHHDMTREDADRIVDALRLPPEFREMLLLAAGTHDLGKNRPAWQSAVGAPLVGRPFAKTNGRRSNPELLHGYRHEFGSLRDAEARVQASVVPELQDLARHLITAHHGFARPVINAQDPDAPPSATTPLAQEAALRFDALQQQWTPWGLAWWEALLRAADWSASRRAAKHQGPLTPQGEEAA
jgi:CRISPR-associated endonuclease/helicase Cas3